jgi:exodeoxyribonuclease VII large subunit
LEFEIKKFASIYMKVLTVSELTQEIKKQLETGIGSLSVRGEISNLKQQASGHIYFTLKDAEAQISAVLFKGSSRGLSRLPKEGDKVVLLGDITVYPPRGNYQILVREVQYQGVGELLIQLHELKAKLEAKGWFAKERKKQLPPFPKTIGVVTSPTGAVIQDIIHILQRRHAGFQLLLNPVKVQGEGAAREIAKAIEQFNTYGLVDVIIVGRGGGSLEDLWAFNEEPVVEAIVRSNIPILSAVGHETDFTLCDFAADVRAPTPSAAAELVIAEKEQQLKFLFQVRQRIDLHVRSIRTRYRQQIQSASKHPYLASPYLLLSQRTQQLDELKSQIQFSIFSLIKHKKLQLSTYEKQNTALQPSNQLKSWSQKFSTIQRSIRSTCLQIIQAKKKQSLSSAWQKKIDWLLLQKLKYQKEKLDQLSSHLNAIDPKNLLTKGYCILFSEIKDSVILSSEEIIPEQSLQILLKDGTVKAKVEEVHHGTGSFKF